MLLGIEGGRPRARRVLGAGETVYGALARSEQARIPTSAEKASEQLDATTRFWRDWLARQRDSRNRLEGAWSRRAAGDPGQISESALTRPVAIASSSAVWSRSFWSAYVFANDAIARSNLVPPPR
jgi:hypothetical protein